MDRREIDFLPTMIGILEKLHATSLERGQVNLAILLDLARNEAEDALRTANHMEETGRAFKNNRYVAN